MLEGALPFASDVRVTDDGVDYVIRLPWLGQVIRPLVWLESRRVAREVRDGKEPRPAVWGPPKPMSLDEMTALATACLLSLLIGYGGALLTQINTFAAKVYGVGGSTLGLGLAVARGGVILALVLSLMADRSGRRSFIARGVIVHGVLVAVAGLAPTFWTFIAGHTLVRAFDTALGVALAVLIAESISAENRAYAVALVGVVGGFGIFLASMVLPIAAAGRGGLILVHLLQLIALPLAIRIRRSLRESPRYLTHQRERTSFRELLSHAYARNLAMAGAALFTVYLFLGPAVELTNRYLDHQRHWGPGKIVLFLLLTSFPFIPMTVVGSRYADLRGRKPVAVIGITGATLTYVALFLVQGWPLWVLGPLASTFIAPGYAATSVYATELFPTRVRSSAGALLHIIGVCGAVIGLVATGLLTPHLGTGRAIAVLGAFPIVACALVALLFPETAQRDIDVTSGDTTVDASASVASS